MKPAAPKSGEAALSTTAPRFALLPLLIMAGLLVLPGLALRAYPVNWRIVSIYAVALNAVTYVAYAWDKRRAQADGWRVSEARLHLLELLGGWPAAYLAQRRLRHKNAKLGYQLVFWLVVLAYQLAAIDSLQNGSMTRAAWDHLVGLVGQRR